MPRANADYLSETTGQALEPIKLVRVIDIPKINEPSTTESLYLTDHTDNVSFFDKDGASKTYLSCALKYDKVMVTSDNEIDSCTLKITNIDRTFSDLAKNYKLNGATVHVLRGFVGSLSTPDHAQVIFRGHIESCSIAATQIEAKITSDFSLKTRIPRRLYWVQDFPELPSSKDPRNINTND